MHFPWYDAETNTQYFPYKSIAMLVGFGLIIGVSWGTDWLMKTGRLDRKYLRFVNNRLDESDADDATDTEKDSRLSSADDDKINGIESVNGKITTRF